MPLQIPSSLTPQLDAPDQNYVSPPAARNMRRNNDATDAIAQVVSDCAAYEHSFGGDRAAAGGFWVKVRTIDVSGGAEDCARGGSPRIPLSPLRRNT